MPSRRLRSSRSEQPCAYRSDADLWPSGFTGGRCLGAKEREELSRLALPYRSREREIARDIADAKAVRSAPPHLKQLMRELEAERDKVVEEWRKLVVEKLEVVQPSGTQLPRAGTGVGNCDAAMSRVRPQVICGEKRYCAVVPAELLGDAASGSRLHVGPSRNSREEAAADFEAMQRPAGPVSAPPVPEAAPPEQSDTALAELCAENARLRGEVAAAAAGATHAMEATRAPKRPPEEPAGGAAPASSGATRASAGGGSVRRRLRVS